MCQDPRVSPFYRCSLFSRNKSVSIITKARPSEFEAIEEAGGLSADLLKALNADDYEVLKVDDRDLPLASNYLEFLTDPRFNTNVRPLPKQLETAIHVMGEFCPRCSNSDYVKNIPFDAGWDYKSDEGGVKSFDSILENVQLLKHGVCPKCGARRSELYNSGELRYYNEYIGLCGQRAGKSLGTAYLEGYNIHRWIKLRKHFSKYGLASNTTLISNYLALTLAQAVENLWDPIINFIDQSTWFKQCFDILDYEGDRQGVELYIKNKLGIKWKHARLSIYPTIPEEGKLRGRTRFGGHIDELSRFPIKVDATDKKIRVNAEEVYNSLSRSLMTLRIPHERLSKKYDDIPGPLSGNISSPFLKNDKLVKLYNANYNDPTSKKYCFRGATWELNPMFPRESLDSEFRDNPVTAMRDYGAVPPDSGSPFINDISIVKACIVRDKINGATATTVPFKTSSGILMLKGVLTLKQEITDDVSRLMTIDVGLSNNSFAICIGHNEVEKETIDGEEKTWYIPSYDVLLELIPHSNLQLNINAVYEDIIKPLIKKFNVKLLVSDKYQGEKLLKDAENDCRVKTETYSLKYPDFKAWREDLFDNAHYFPRMEVDNEDFDKLGDDNYPKCFTGMPVSHFVHQCKTVQEITNIDVTKGDDRTDDLFTVCVMAHSYLTDPNYTKSFSGEGKSTSRGGGLIGVIATSQDRQGQQSQEKINSSIGVLVTSKYSNKI